MKFIGSIFLILLLFVIIQINWKLYYKPSSLIIEGRSVNKDLLLELRSLRTSMESGAAADMQKLFPEGYLFMNALYGLSWCEVASTAPLSSDLYAEAHREDNIRTKV